MPSARPSANFTRPADTTAYTSGDLVANSTTAGSVVPMSFAITHSAPYGPITVLRAKVMKSTNSLTAASFRIHLYTTLPTVQNGDNGVWLSSESGYMGSLDVTVDKAFSDGTNTPSAGSGTLISGTGVQIAIAGGTDQTIYGLLEARGAYTPGNAEVFTVTLEVYMGSS